MQPAPSWLLSALPPKLRDKLAGMVLRGDGRVMLQFPALAIDVAPAAAQPQAYRISGPFAFSYRVAPGASAQTQALAARVCDALARALPRRTGPQLSALLRAPAPEPEPHEDPHTKRAEGPRVMLYEDELSRDEDPLAELRAIDGPVSAVELFLSAPCNQACRFCAYSNIRGGPGDLVQAPGVLAWIHAILDDLRARPSPAVVVLSGPDCLRHREIAAILDLFEGAPDITLELLGPLTRLAAPEIAERLPRLPRLRALTSSLFSHRAEIHDAIVGCPGAHAEVLRAIDLALDLELPIGLNVLLLPANVDEFPELLAFMAARGVGLHAILYHPESWNDELGSWRRLDARELVVEGARVHAAFARIPPEQAEQLEMAYFPHCWLPPAIRPRNEVPGNYPLDDFRFAEACRSCPARASCCGVTIPVYEAFGEASVDPSRL